ncbi:hypothetical protein ACK36J_02615 [Aeromonas veronii]
MPNPFHTRANHPTVPVYSTDGSPVGRRHIVEELTPVDIVGTIRCAVTGRPLWIAPSSPTDRANRGATAQLNPMYKSALHHVVDNHRQTEAVE